MKQVLVIFLFCFSLTNTRTQVTLDYYLPGDISYDPSIPTPESVIGHQVGEWHITHDKLLLYMHEIARVSDRAIIEEYGKTYENRSLVHLVFTSPENHKKLEVLRRDHLKLCNPALSPGMNIREMPLFINLGYSVHGNEASGANSSLLTVYYLAAAQGPGMEELLRNTVILVDPCLNPDGLVRHSTWANMHRSRTLTTDPDDRGFGDIWPGGRTNHYWFDLNRDWLLLQQPESQARVKWFHDWKPNIVTDHHEMGSSSTFFFQPGIPGRNNPLTPPRNYELTRKIAAYHAKALDGIGSLYYSEETFDDFYFGKGSSYPDINSGIGILFEQAGIRGIARETDNGIVTFPFSIRNQFTVTLSSLQAGNDLRTELLEHQREFYLTALQDAAKDNVKAYVFGDPFDRARTFHFIDLLGRHQIKVYRLKQDVEGAPGRFSREHSYIVPLAQPQYRMIRTLFEKVTTYRDSTFYDVSAWTLPLAFNLPYREIRSAKELPLLLGDELQNNIFPEGKITGGKSRYGYLFRWDEYYTPRALYRVLSEGLRAKVATQEFTCRDDQLSEKFSYGTIFIPVAGQELDEEEIFALLGTVAAENGLEIFSVTTGWTPEGIDLGSGSFSPVEKPEILMMVGEGTNSREAGELWHLFDQRYHIPVTMAEVQEFRDLNLKRYTTLMLVSGSYREFGEAETERLKAWVREGGTLIACEGANEWLSRSKLAPVSFKKPAPLDTARTLRYIDMSKTYSIQRIAGGIFEVEIDLTHPLGYGYHRNRLPVFKDAVLFAEKSNDPFRNPAVYTDNPLMSGFISPENLQRLKGAPFLITHPNGSGIIISVMDNTNFRAFWYGTNKILANAVLFGPIIR